MYEYVGKTQKSFMRGVITFSSGITYTLMPNWPSSKRKITIFCQMDQCVYYILKAIHACPNATWKVCSHILVSKKSRRESWHKRERHPMVRKFRGGENSSSKLVDTYSRGFIWDARNDALQGGPARHCVSQCSLQKTTQITLLYVVGTRQSIASFPYCVNVLSTCAICVTCIFSGD